MSKDQSNAPANQGEENNTGQAASPTPEPPKPAPAPPTPDTTQGDAQDAPEPQGKGNAEAAKYRTRLRETEAERDALTEQLATAQDQILNHHLAAAKVDVRIDAIRKVGIDTSNLLNEDKTLNEEALKTVFAEFEAMGFILKKPTPISRMSGQPGPNIHGEPQVTWTDALGK